MEVTLDTRLQVELRQVGSPQDSTVYRADVTDDLGDLVEETFARGVMSGKLVDGSELFAAVRVEWAEGSKVVTAIDVALAGESKAQSYSRRFTAGRWNRRCLQVRQELIERGVLDETADVRRVLTGEPAGVRIESIPVQSPVITDQSLKDLGIANISASGRLESERPILISEQMIEDIVAQTERSGPTETGGAVIGKVVRLAEPLDGTATTIITVLAVGLMDSRHVGEIGKFTFSPDALIEAAQIAEIRGRGEAVQTVWHSHGWGTECGDCNENADCALPQCTTLSTDDYQVLESLFPAKTTLMPVAGRRLGGDGKRPVLVVHGWCGGEMRPLRFGTYRE